MLTVDEAVVRVEWEQPEGGTQVSVTDEQILNFQVECSIFQSDNQTYTLKQTLSSDILKAFLPKLKLFPFSVTLHYNCCVEAEFETYSSKACSTTMITSFTTDAIKGPKVSCNNPAKIVAATLGTIMLILITVSLVATVALVYGCYNLANTKRKHFLWYVFREVCVLYQNPYLTIILLSSSMASDVNTDRVLDNPTYGEGETFNNSTSALPGATIEMNSSHHHYVQQSVSPAPSYEPVCSIGKGAMPCSLSLAEITTTQQDYYEIPFTNNNLQS